MINIIEERYYFTFKDHFNDALQGSKNLDVPIALDWSNEILFENLMIWGITFEQYVKMFIDTQTGMTKTYMTDIMKYVFGRYANEYIFYGTSSNIGDYTEERFNFINKLMTTLLFTYDRYKKLLDIYASEESKLLDGVKTTTTGIGRFNDTPQDIQEDADAFGDDSHVTNITKSTAEAISDVDTKIARLDEIARKYRNIYLEWTNEFAPLFIERNNIL